MYDDWWVKKMDVCDWIVKHFKFTKDVMQSENNLAYTNMRCQAVSTEVRRWWMRWMRWVDMMRLLWFYGWCMLKCMRWWWGWTWTGGWGSLACTPSSQWTSTWQQTLGKNNWSKFLRFPRLEYDLVTCGKPLPLFAFTKTDYKQTVIILFRDCQWLMTNNKPLFGWWKKIVIIPIISLKIGAFPQEKHRQGFYQHPCRWWRMSEAWQPSKVPVPKRPLKSIWKDGAHDTPEQWLQN